MTAGFARYIWRISRGCRGTIGSRISYEPPSPHASCRDAQSACGHRREDWGPSKVASTWTRKIGGTAVFGSPKHVVEGSKLRNTPGKYSFIRGNSGNAIRPRSLAGDVVSCWCAPACAYGWRIGRATLGCPDGRETAIPLLSVSVPKRRRLKVACGVAAFPFGQSLSCLSSAPPEDTPDHYGD